LHVVVSITVLCRLDLDAPWDLTNNYVARAINDAVEAVAGAIDKVIRECLGDPMSQAVIAKALRGSVLEVSTARLPIRLDKKGRRFVIEISNLTVEEH
jgi:hypothetical protein